MCVVVVVGQVVVVVGYHEGIIMNLAFDSSLFVLHHTVSCIRPHVRSFDCVEGNL